MKQWKTGWICLFVAFCVALNVGGRLFSTSLQLPFWLDSFGTVFCACLLGPVCGALVGVTGNLLVFNTDPTSWAYSLTSIALAVIVGFAVKRKSFEKLQGCMAVSVMVTVAAVVISVPLNGLLNGGQTSNKFGDAVIQYLAAHDFPKLLCAIAGQFYVEFLDKLLTIFVLYLILRFIHREERSIHHWRSTNAAKKAEKALILAVAAGILLNLNASGARAEDLEEPVRYADYVQTVYSSNNGLPCGEANDIAMTTDGILWVGTYAGLYRYNGKEFRWMDSMENVRNAKCLYVDPEGRLWIGTNDSGLAISIHEEIVNVLDQESGLAASSVHAITQGADGYYYIGTTGSLQILSLSGGLKIVSTLQEVNATECLTADESGYIAAVTSDGRLFLLQGTEILCSLRCAEPGEEFSCCAFDPDGILIVGTTASRLLFYEVSNDFFELAYEQTCEDLSNINDLYFPGNGEMFVTADNGVAYLSREGIYHRINTNEFNNSIDNVLMDYQGNLWFTSSRLGLLRLASSSFKDIYTTLGMKSSVANAVAQWQGNLYFGTDSGLDAVDASCSTRVSNFLTEQLEGVRIRCLMVDDQNRLWVCTHGGLWEVHEDETIRIYNTYDGLYGNKVRVAKQLSDGTILAAGDNGLSFIRDDAVVKTFTRADGLTNSIILTVSELADGRILVGTNGGGLVFLENGEITKSVRRSNGLSSEVILRTVPDTKSNGVFLVTSNGLCYLEEDGSSVRELTRFPYFNNYDVWERDEDTLFIMSSAGLYVTDRDTLLSTDPREELRVELFDARRGLNSSLTANSWTYCDAAGNLYLPCDTGVFSINSRSFSSALPSFRMAIPYVRLDGTLFPFSTDETLVIGTGVSRIELFPEIINYSVQIPNVGYYLEGFDSDWTVLSQTSLSSIVYTNLPAGNYLLHLAVFNSETGAVATERTFDLAKVEEFYETTGFKLYFFGVILLFALFVFLLFGYRSYIKLQEKAEMANQTIIAIANTVDAKDARTSQHSQRVSKYAVEIAKEMGKQDNYCENLRKAALMHDIGKIAIPDAILNKPSRLTDDEYAVMKSHTTHGGEILKDMTLIKDVAVGAKYHHERWDGKGYPSGLSGEEIPEMARIIGVADAFDAMTANRVYRKQMDFDYVINEMEKGRGTQFDPEADDALLKLLHDGSIDLNKIYGVTPEEKKP